MTRVSEDEKQDGTGNGSKRATAVTIALLGIAILGGFVLAADDPVGEQDEAETSAQAWPASSGTQPAQAPHTGAAIEAGIQDGPLDAVQDPTASTQASGEPWVEIEDPQDGDVVEGPTTITGSAGSTTTDGETSSKLSPTAAARPSASSISTEPGGDLALWFHGEEIHEGIGQPTAATPGILLPEPPAGQTPVLHSGQSQLVPIELLASPLDDEIRLGTGDVATPNQGNATLHLSMWTTVDWSPTVAQWIVEIDAVHPTLPDLPLATTERDFPANDIGPPTPVPTPIEIPLELGEVLRIEASTLGEDETIHVGSLNDAPVDEHGDLLVPAGYQLRFEFYGENLFEAATYTAYYGTEAFDSHLSLPVSPMHGNGPTITTFQPTPDQGQAPLTVNLSGQVDAGVDPVSQVTIDPGDGADTFEAVLAENGTFYANHTYKEVGTWTATATATDTANRTGTATTDVTVNPDAAVHVRIADGEPEQANDTSQEDDWSSWEIQHDFGQYENGTQVTIEATYFDGETTSKPHTITVTAGEPLPANVTIDAPEEGATLTFPAQFEGTYQIPEEPTASGSSTMSDGSTQQPVDQGQREQRLASATHTSTGTLHPDLDPRLEALEPWLTGDPVQETLSSPTVRAFHEQAVQWEGFLTIVPDVETGDLAVALSGEAPLDAPRSVGDWSIRYVEGVDPEPLADDLQDPSDDHEGPSIPGIQGNGAGPGSPLRIGNFICTASYLVHDEVTERYFISTAGHCLTGEGEHTNVAQVISVCIESCITNVPQIGQYVTFFPDGDYVPVFYSINDDIGRDFGLIEVPDDRVDDLRPYLTQWGGPDGVEHPGPGQLLAHYGHGAYCCPGVGAAATRSPVDQGRLAISLGSGFDSFSAIGWPTGGDSGSAVGTAQLSTSDVVQGRNAAGVLTHGVIVAGAPILWGTTMTNGMLMAEAATGSDLRLVTQDENPTPVCESDQACPPVARFDHEIVELDASFDASASFHPRYANIVSYAWDFGDGATGEGEQVTHRYAQAGSYNVTLTVTDEEGRQDTVTKTVDTQEPDTAWRLDARILDEDAQSVVPWQTLEHPEDGEQGTWRFTWDEPPEESGTYTLQVRVTEDGEERAFAERDYEVVPLRADAGGPYEGLVGEAIAFNGTAENGVEPYAFAWELGDGTTKTGQTVTHAYEQAGTYNVTLTVTDDAGQTAQNTTTALVHDTEPEPFVEIASPEDGETVWGPTLIEGTAGHERPANESDQDSMEETQHDGNLQLVDPTSWPTPSPTSQGLEAAAADGSFAYEPGQETTLWFRGDEIQEGIGQPTISQPGTLSTQAPTGDTPVLHSGQSNRVPVDLLSAPLEDEIRFGTGDATVPNEASAMLHLSLWSTIDWSPTVAQWIVEIDAVHPTLPDLPLAATERDFPVTDVGPPRPVPTPTEIPLELGQVLRIEASSLGEDETMRLGPLAGAPIDVNGDLVVPEGYQLGFTFYGENVFEALTYTIYYDTEEFDSQLSLPVSPHTGSPEIVAFDATPSQGSLPLEVNLSGLVEAGLDPVTEVIVDPGDGSDPLRALLAENGSFHAHHVYEEAGTWTATALARDAANRTDTASTTATIEQDEGVYVRVQDQLVGQATDTSEEGDWSTWEIRHDFSQYRNDTEVSIEAVYFDGEDASEPHRITVTANATTEEPEPLEAVIEGPDRVRWQQNATFDGSNSTGDIVEWIWDFDDGTRAAGPVVEHAWEEPGPKDVMLTVKDRHGEQASATHQVMVQGGPGSQS